MTYIIKKDASGYISPNPYWTGSNHWNEAFTSFLLLAKRYSSREEAEKDLDAAQHSTYVGVKVWEIFE